MKRDEKRGFYSPEIHFSLSVVLEEDEQSYPKYPQEQSLHCGFIQADRLYFSFFKERPEIKFSVNLQDDKQTKYRPIIDGLHPITNETTF